MKHKVWKKHHKWFGLLFSFFMLMFCVSGIVLNHRQAVSGIQVNRTMLPDAYHFKDWNNGLLRGSLPYRTQDGSKNLFYGNSGIWLTDSAFTCFHEFDQGFPQGADHKTVKGMVQTPDSTLLAASQFGLYRYEGQSWVKVALPGSQGDRLTDITLKGDTVAVADRSYIYMAVPPYADFCQLELKAPADYNGKVSLFRTVWMLHSGEMFGLLGKLFMDGVAVVLVLLCLSGCAYWLLPKAVKRLKKSGKKVQGYVQATKFSLLWHDRIGRYTFYLLLFVAFTGWCLRPPVLIALVQADVPAVPGTRLHSPNAWNDKLRMVRYDESQEEWIVSTSEGFYALRTLRDIPEKIAKQPPVSVMGLNVWERDADGNWLCGSFSGMFRWNRNTDQVTDYFTGDPAPESAGAPFGKKAISGYCRKPSGDLAVVEYDKGCKDVEMPREMEGLPMSLWNLALEIHTGRIYTVLGPGTLVYIFFAGAAALWVLLSGYKIRIRKK